MNDFTLAPANGMLVSVDCGAVALRLDGKLLARDVEQRLHELIARFQSDAGLPPGQAARNICYDPGRTRHVNNKDKA